MADFYKNIDVLGCESEPMGAHGVQYDVVTDLAVEPVDIAFFKQHARIDFATDDNLVTAYIKAARQDLERWAQLSFGVKTMRITALELPKNFRLMFGRVDTVLTAGFTNFGDILREGGKEVEIEYTTLDWIGEDIKIAICRYAAGLYINRENYVTAGNYVGNTNNQTSRDLIDEAKKIVKPYANLTLL